MKIRTIYFKVTDMQKSVKFWKELLNIDPHKTSDEWHEFMVGNVRLGLLKNPADDIHSGSNCVPVFEFSNDELPQYIDRAKRLGAHIIVNGLEDLNLQSIVFSDPWNNEFELSKFHD